MPNWCDNRLYISISPFSGKDITIEDGKKQIKEFLSKAEVVEENGEVVKLAPGDYPKVYDKAPSGRLY